MNLPISNSPVRPPPSLKPHTIRHLFSGAIVFLMGVLVNEGIVYYRAHRPRVVTWANGEAQKDFVIRQKLPPLNPATIDIGVTDDGVVVWREKKK